MQLNKRMLLTSIAGMALLGLLIALFDPDRERFTSFAAGPGGANQARGVLRLGLAEGGMNARDDHVQLGQQVVRKIQTAIL